jgi:hypothetical protein
MKAKLKPKLMMFGVVFLFLWGPAAASASAPVRGRDCRYRCHVVYRERSARCDGLPREQRRRCEARAREAFRICLNRCAN